MKAQGNDCPAFSQHDILLLKGSPMAKKLTPLRASTSLYKEEWIYYNNANEEHFIFTNQRLIGYKIV